MKIIYFLLAFFASNFVQANELILVKKQPTYKIGEKFTGKFISPSGSLSKMSQVVLQNSEGKKIVRLSIYEDVVFKDRIFYADPLNWFNHLLSYDIEKFPNPKTDCSRKKLYPIYIGKVYTCRTNVSMDKVESVLTTKMVFNRTLGSDNKNLSFCARITETSDATITFIETCYDKTGKWIKSYKIFGEYPLKRV